MTVTNRGNIIEHKTVQMLKMGDETQPLGSEEHDTKWGPRMYSRLPYDFPAYIRVIRRLHSITKGKVNHSGDLLGWTWELDLFTFGVKVWVRVDRKPRRLRIFVEDEDGRTNVGDYTIE
jgi:hypothetical protein